MTHLMRRTRLGVALALAICATNVAIAAPGDDDDEDEDEDDRRPTPPRPTAVLPKPAPVPSTPRELVCDGNWRYSLVETRSETGPARFATQHEVQRDFLLVSAALAKCATLNKSGKLATDKHASTVCEGLRMVASQRDIAAANVLDSKQAPCLGRAVQPGDACEGPRTQLTTLRRYDHLVMSRAELALSADICANPAAIGATLKKSCTTLHEQITAEAGDQGGVGPFGLDAPLPAGIVSAVEAIRQATDRRFQAQIDNSIGARDACQKMAAPLDDKFDQQRVSTAKSMCAELTIADNRAATCRRADVYIDERGELHMQRPLTTSAQRRNATLCVDISDFDTQAPLVVAVGIGTTASVPERVWPGETFQIGKLLDASVTREDVLAITVYGRARGSSLAEFLSLNGVTPDMARGEYAGTMRDEACRIATQLVPVVEHEVPVGSPDKQAVIPIVFGRGRDGETRTIEGGDAVMLWVRGIEPGGSVMVEQSGGKRVIYEPPPLVGQQPAPNENVESRTRPATSIRGGMAGIAVPSVRRRARYGGSRVIRLGHPAGNHNYDLKVCTGTMPLGQAGRDPLDTRNRPLTCGGGNVILDEKLYVHGTYHLGVRAHFGYTYFDEGTLRALRTPEAQQLGTNVHEVVSERVGSPDFAVLLAIYPFGRDPYRFDYKFWTPRGNYWEHAALLAGFTARKLSVWDNIYLGGSLPLASGVSFTVLANLAMRNQPIGVRAGDFITSSSSAPDLSAMVGSQRRLDVGVSVGISLDYDLAERAFKAVWSKVRQTPSMTATSSSDSAVEESEDDL